MPTISLFFGPTEARTVGGVRSTPNVVSVLEFTQLPSASQNWTRRSYAPAPVATPVSARLVTLVNGAHAVELAPVPCGAHCVAEVTLSTPKEATPRSAALSPSALPGLIGFPAAVPTLNTNA